MKQKAKKIKILLKCNASALPLAAAAAYLVVLPLCLIVCKKYGFSARTEETVVRYTQFFLPPLAALLPAGLMNSYVGANKNEVLYLHRRLIVFDVLPAAGLYCLLLVPEFAVFTLAAHISFLEFFRLAIEILFFCALTYFLCFLTDSVSIGCLAVLIYYFLSITVLAGRLPAFFNVQSFEWGLFFDYYIYLLAAAFVLLGGGAVRNKFINTKSF